MDDPERFLPFDDDAQSPIKSGVAPRVLSDAAFAYVGRALTLAEFASYVASYSFGPIPPDFIVLHHTAVPSASWARYPSGLVWDANEGGLNEAQIKAKRLRQLDSIMRYYRDSKGWTAGPHLFIDDRWIYLFTPMNMVGIHAAQGNGWRDRTGLHYSVGIEIVGYYEHTRWPTPIATLVRGAVRALLGRLPKIRAEYVRGPGGICSHRDWNKPACPGAAITGRLLSGRDSRRGAPARPLPRQGGRVCRRIGAQRPQPRPAGGRPPGGRRALDRERSAGPIRDAGQLRLG
jgi:hypothetical protein